MAAQTAPLPAELRELLKLRRKDRGWSQRALADRMDTAQSALSELENGVDDRSLVLSTLKAWCNSLGYELHLKLTDKESTLEFKV